MLSRSLLTCAWLGYWLVSSTLYTWRGLTISPCGNRNGSCSVDGLYTFVWVVPVLLVGWGNLKVWSRISLTCPACREITVWRVRIGRDAERLEMSYSRKCQTCSADRITVPDAFRIVNEDQDACGSCVELAWYLVDGGDDPEAAFAERGVDGDALYQQVQS